MFKFKFSSRLELLDTACPTKYSR